VPEDQPEKHLCCSPQGADEPLMLGQSGADEPMKVESKSVCRRDNVIPFQDPEDAQTNRQLKAMTAATILWVAVLLAAAAAVLFAVPWAVRGVFSWFGIY